jgi:hypothetical protein
MHAVKCTFDIHPPLEYDDEDGHLNQMLADEHIPYSARINANVELSPTFFACNY